MSFVSDFLPTLHAIRAIPHQLGLRPHTVVLLHRSYDGAHTGAGTVTTTETPITHSGGANPRVRVLNDEEIALGQLGSGTVEIGPLTPELAVEIADLNGSTLAVGQVLQVRITGPMHPGGAVYRVLSVQADRAMHYTVRAAPSGTE